MAHLLIVDDEESICWALRRLADDEGHTTSVASSAEQAYERAAERGCDLLMLDVRLPGADGLSAMARLQTLAPTARIVVMTAFGNLTTAVTALRNGAFDYLTKPFDLAQAASVIRRALTERPSASTTREAAQPYELLGHSAAMQEVFKRIALAAPTHAAVLITGESGTGKELVARALHRHSLCAEGPLLPVNLAALNPSLVESELFGHVRGAFTGADSARRGVLELAHGGTVFFDEMGDVPAAVQVKLLRALEQQEVVPVGDVRPRRTSFRVLAATHRDLRAEVAAGRFREDLFFRLAVFEIRLPPLRERVEDIPCLAEHFLHTLSADQAASFSDDALAELGRRPWPGNVRELRNAVEHAALLARGSLILPEHLPPCSEPQPSDGDVTADLNRAVVRWVADRLSGPVDPTDLYQQFLAETEPTLLNAALSRTGNNRLAAANLLGIHRATLRKKMP
jgi:DNA-binding NtrC family response regulator